MSAFPNWQEYVVIQRRPQSGCIPTGYEMLLRAAGVQGVDFNTFQDEFDLDKNRQDDDLPRNNFESVADAVNQRYPTIHFKVTVFPKTAGTDKLRFVESNITHQRLVLISLNMLPVLHHPGWHIMPVVDMDEENLLLVYGALAVNQIRLLKLPKTEFVRIHQQFDGGNDVAYLDD